MSEQNGKAGNGPRRCILLILDGLGDVPVPALEGRTPLEAAHTPRLDRMAAAGLHGLVDPIGEGIVPNTHTGVGMLLGLLPEQAAKLKRGPVEASGAGRVLEPGEIAFRANFATLERSGDRLFVADRRAGRITSGAKELASVLTDLDLGDGISASFLSTDQHRGALVLSGSGLHAALSDTDPGDGHTPSWLKPCRPKDEASVLAAEKVNRFIDLSHDLLRSHSVNRAREWEGKLPASGVITRGAGAWFSLDNLLASNGVRPVMVAGCNTVAGLARIFGMDTVRKAAFTADTHTDVRGKLEAAVDALEEHSMVFVHIKAPDLFSHDFQPVGKKDFIERVDAALETLDGVDAVFAVAADHTTSSISGAHSAEPIPALIYDPLASTGTGAAGIKFSERACRTGSMPRQNGHEFLKRLVSSLV
jgi:2,3-bisphosphoglycerate-independent phosphoglycerate mutase